MEARELAAVAKALGHPARVQIVALLAEQAECRGHDVFAELPLAQSTVSEHLRVLREAGVVSASARGTSTVYCLAPDVLAAFGASVAALAERGRSCSSKGACS